MPVHATASVARPSSSISKANGVMGKYSAPSSASEKITQPSTMLSTPMVITDFQRVRK